jgi:hypothetical protein
MAAAEFALLTVWRLPARIDAVWTELEAPEHWPDWWRYVKRVVELKRGDASGLGAIRRFTWSSRLPYTLSFDVRVTKVEKPHLLEGRAQGELDGTGTWRLAEAGGVTTVRYDWRVRATKAWMRLAAPLARPVFAWNHHGVMQAGGEGLARRLGTRLLEAAPATR